MITVGVTGGIGSGKTTVCKIWEEMGATVVYADDLAKEMMVTDQAIKKKLIEIFGEETYQPDGPLNKKHLIEEAFEKGRVDELNGIVHPALHRKTEEMMRSAEKKGTALFVKEAAVLLNEGRPEYLDLVVIVKSPKEKRISRVAERDGVSRNEVLSRMNKQPDFDRLHNLADYVIENSGSIKELKREAIDLYHRISGKE